MNWDELQAFLQTARSVLLVGRVGVGKSYTGHRIKELGFTHVDIDTHIRAMSKTHPAGDKLFGIYHVETRDLYNEEMNQILRSIIQKESKMVYDGQILAKDVASINPDVVIVIEPADWNDYKIQLRWRVEEDIRNDTMRVGAIVVDYETKRFQPGFLESAELTEAIEAKTLYTIKKTKELYEKYKEFKLVTYKNKFVN